MAEDDQSYKNIALLDALMSQGSDCKAQDFAKILEEVTQIDYVVPPRDIFKLDQPSYRAGNTILQIARELNRSEICESLIEAGADFTKRNNNGLPLLHLEADKEDDRYFNFKTGRLHNEHFIDMVLQAHIRYNNTTNPKDQNGISHFHISCMHNKVQLVERFLLSGVSVNETVNEVSPIFAGYTPLHFAVKYCAIETVELLLEYGADTHMKNSKGLNPLNLLIDEKLNTWTQMVRRIGAKANRNESHYYNLSSFHEKIERIIALLLERKKNGFGLYDDTGLSYFHIICTMKDSWIVQQHLDRHYVDLEQAVNSSSALWPGYTALHFAAHFNKHTVKLLLARGANLGARDAQGLTPFDICLRSMKIKSIHSIYSLYPAWADIRFSDGKTKLSDFIYAMRTTETFDTFMHVNVDDPAMFIPFDSPICAGYTIFHLNIVCSEMPLNWNPENVDYSFTQVEYLTYMMRVGKCKIELMRKTPDANAHARDARGSTAIHLAFNLQQSFQASDLLYYCKTIPNIVDERGFSLLHISCATKNVHAASRLMSDGANVNERTKCRYTWYVTNSGSPESRVIKLTFAEGSSPLHISTIVKSPETVDLLIAFNADVLAKDADNLTPLERSLGTAIFENEREPTWKIKTKTITDEEVQILDSLITRVSELLADTRPDHMLYCYSLLQDEVLSRLFAKDHEPTRRILASVGITMLHIACLMKNRRKIEEELENDADVNARVDPKSPFWPGRTPFHILMYPYGPQGITASEEHVEMANLLLANGADVAVKDALDDTPLHQIFQYYLNTGNHGAYLYMLLSHIKDFSVNSVNAKGLTYLHAACATKTVTIVEKLLEHGVEINQAVDYFHDKFGGWTALHFAVAYQSKKVVELLLKHGADVNWKNVFEETPLHTFAASKARPRCLNVFQSLISAGADMGIRNVFGDRSLESLIKANATTNEIKHYLKTGCPVNVWNPVNQEGCLAFALEKTETQPIFGIMMKALDIKNIDEEGRNAIHNVVSFVRPDSDELNEYSVEAISHSEAKYCLAIRALTKLDLDIDHQDHKGSSPLHIAAKLQNIAGIVALLTNGANINVVDGEGKPPFAYSVELVQHHDHMGELDCQILEIILAHQIKLTCISNELSESNRELLKDILNILSLESTLPQTLRVELEKMIDWKFGSYSITLRDFMSNTGVVSLFPFMSSEKREAINHVFKNEFVKLFKAFNNFACLLVMQYRKAVARVDLVEPAEASFNFLAGFPMPDVCLRIILRYLSNDDLKNLIDSASV